MSDSPIKILVYPKASNPYQNLLYDNKIISKSFYVEYVNITKTKSLSINLLIFPFRLLLYRLNGFKIFHLHWLYEFQAPPHNGYFVKLFFTLYVISLFYYIKLIGFKLVWTMHEVIPNEQEFIDDVFTRRLISRLSDVSIFHSRVSLYEAINNGFYMKKSYIIPHGNYRASYKNNLSKVDARNKLKLKKTDFCFLFFWNDKTL